MGIISSSLLPNGHVDYHHQTAYALRAALAAPARPRTSGRKNLGRQVRMRGSKKADF